MKPKHWSTEKAHQIVLLWGNMFNWGNCSNCCDHDHISPEESKRLEQMIAVALRVVAKKALTKDMQ